MLGTNVDGLSEEESALADDDLLRALGRLVDGRLDRLEGRSLSASSGVVAVRRDVDRTVSGPLGLRPRRLGLRPQPLRIHRLATSVALHLLQAQVAQETSVTSDLLLRRRRPHCLKA